MNPIVIAVTGSSKTPTTEIREFYTFYLLEEACRSNFKSTPACLHVSIKVL